MYSFLNPSVELLYTTSWLFPRLQISKNCREWDDKWNRLKLLQVICDNLIYLLKTKKTRCDDNPRKKAVSEPSPEKVCASKFYPKSLSIQDMLKLGKVISKKSSTVISIYKFDFEHMQWSNVPMEAEFLVAESPFASGGFRRAFKATSITEGFKEVTWVVKKYLKSASEIIKATQETEESHTKKSVQMHYLARNFASQLMEQIEKEQLMEFGPTFEYKKSIHG